MKQESTPSSSVLSILTIFVLFFTVAVPAIALQTYWQHDPATPGSWHDPANWDNGIPDSYGYDYAYIDNGGTAQITANASSDCLYLGYDDFGAVEQTGGINTVSWDGEVYLGYSSGSSGTYNLSGTGQLSAWREHIGLNGTGEFNQSGGTNTASLRLGYNSGSSGTYNLSDGQLSAESEYIGYYGTGVFNQTGGTNTVDYLYLGYESGSGTYNLVDGQLSGEELYIGGWDEGSGSFIQSGGECTFDWIEIGTESEEGALYRITGGTLKSPYILVGGGWDCEGPGSMEIGGNAIVEVRNMIVGSSYDRGGPAPSSIIMTGGKINPYGAIVSGALLVSGSASQSAVLSGYGIINMELNNHGTVRADDGILLINGPVSGQGAGEWIIEDDGELRAGGLIRGDVTNAGVLSAHNGALILLCENVTNTGTLKNEVGCDLFVHAFSNLVHTGNIEVNAMGVVSFDTPITNGLGKRVDLLGGVLAAPTVTNEAGGTITGFGGITGDMENYGFVDLYGTANIVGDVHNCAGGELWARNDVILITGLTTNDYGATIHTFSAKFIFNGGLINNGSLITDPTTVEFNNDLTVGEHGTIQTDPGDRYVFLQFASLVNMSTENEVWDTEGAILQFNGNGMEMMPQTLEASGADLGAVLAGFIDNFAWNTLQVGTSDTYLQILDEYDSSVPLLEGYGEIGPNEAIYVHNLMLEAGATLDLNGYNLYYDGEFTDNGGTILNGAPIHVESIPEPATLLLLAPALLGLAGVMRRMY